MTHYILRVLVSGLLVFLSSCVNERPFELFVTNGPMSGTSFRGTGFRNKTIEVHGPGGELFRGRWGAAVNPNGKGGKGAAFLKGDRGGHMDLTIKGGGDGHGFGSGTDSAGNAYRMIY